MAPKEQRHLLERVMRLNECGEHAQAVKLSSELIDCNSAFAEAITNVRWLCFI